MIRRGTPEDIAAIAPLYERSFATLTFLPVLHTLAEHQRWFAAVMERDELWVYEEDGAIVGFMMLGDEILEYIFLEPQVFGRGIGAALLDLAKERRPAGFTLWTFQENERARAFYKRHGLEEIQLTDGADNEEKTPDVQYAWRPPS
jgi:ribosomal protein S18 acetylase RimI-like enzyme